MAHSILIHLVFFFYNNLTTRAIWLSQCYSEMHMKYVSKINSSLYSAFPRFLMLSASFHHYYIKLNMMGAEQAQMLTGHSQNKWLWAWLQGWRAHHGRFQFQEKETDRGSTNYNKSQTTSFNWNCHETILAIVIIKHILEVLRQWHGCLLKGQTNFLFQNLIDGYYLILIGKKENNKV